MLNVEEKVLFDNTLVRVQYHSHLPYASTSFDNNDEIRIPIGQADAYTLPSNSHIYIEGSLLKTDGKTKSATAKFVNNFVAHLFEEIRYEIGGKIIDKIRNPGVGTTLKGYVSFNENSSKRLKNAGWSIDDNCTYNVEDKDGNFNVCVPLKMLLGFAEDYKKLIINLKQELVLIRSNSDFNAIYNSVTTGDDDVKVNINKIVWKVPHILVSDEQRLNLLRVVESGSELEIAFRSMDLSELPVLPKTKEFTWAIKSTSLLEKPRYVILGFQTNRKNKTDKNASIFDACDLFNVKLFLNSEQYPYDNLNLDFKKGKFASLYEFYSQFQSSFYETENPEPLLSIDNFQKFAPITVIDCSRQNEVLNNVGAIDIRLEFETNSNFPESTSAFCLILHDKILRYNALTGMIRTL